MREWEGWDLVPERKKKRVENVSRNIETTFILFVSVVAFLDAAVVFLLFLFLFI